MADIPKHTMLYNNVNPFEVARLRVTAHNVFTAPLRPRKTIVPGRSGAFDYGARYHDERILRVECLIGCPIDDAQFDSLKYIFSRRGRIILWDQPDRYYYGQCYDAAEVLNFNRLSAATFTLNFVCDPYATALEPTIITSTQAIMPVQYKGTRETPTRITIRNTGTTSLRGVTITARAIQ